MAINDPIRKLVSLTVKEVDIKLLSKQHNELEKVLTSKHIKDKQRDALFGIKNLVEALMSSGGCVVSTGNRSKRTTMTQKIVCEAKDLISLGHTIYEVMEQLGLAKSTVEKIKQGGFDDKFTYVQSKYMEVK